MEHSRACGAGALALGSAPLTAQRAVALASYRKHRCCHMAGRATCRPKSSCRSCCAGGFVVLTRVDCGALTAVMEGIWAVCWNQGARQHSCLPSSPSAWVPSVAVGSFGPDRMCFKGRLRHCRQPETRLTGFDQQQRSRLRRCGPAELSLPH